MIRRVGFSGALLVSHHTETLTNQTTTGCLCPACNTLSVSTPHRRRSQSQQFEKKKKKKRVDKLLVWAHLLSLSRCCGCSVVLSHPQRPLSGTGVLWVLTGTHRCGTPPRQVGGVNRAPARAVRCCLGSCSCSVDVV